METDSSTLAVQAAKDPCAFSELYERYYRRVYNYTRYRCLDGDTADDLTAQVFEHLLERINQYRPERGPFEPWLFALARNVVNGHFRRSRFPWLSLDILLHRPSPQVDVETTVIAHENGSELLKALSGLDERGRDVLSLKFKAGLNNRQIAALLHISESHAGVIVYRALGSLRSAMLPGKDEDAPHGNAEEVANERA